MTNLTSAIKSDLGKLSPLLQRNAKVPPPHPSRCGRRYALKNGYGET
jgi:hypothetical protein